MALVRNMATLETKVYTCSPREAVISAFAQSRGDLNTWDYEQKYGPQVIEGKQTVACGDWTCFKDCREG